MNIKKEETMKKVMKLLNRLAPKRGVIVVHRFASTVQVRTDSSIFNISLAMAESLHNNDYS